MVVLADRICQRSSIHQALIPTASPHRHEEKVAHNRPLLRRVLDPFSKRPVVDNFQRGSRSIAAVRTRFHPQIWRKRQKACGSPRMAKLRHRKDIPTTSSAISVLSATTDSELLRVLPSLKERLWTVRTRLKSSVLTAIRRLSCRAALEVPPHQ